MDDKQQRREERKKRRRELRKRRKANLLYIHATSKLKMKLAKVPPPDSDEDLTSTLGNLKNGNKDNSDIDSPDEYNNRDTKNKDQVPSRNNDANIRDNTNYEPASSDAESNVQVDEVENCRNIQPNSNKKSVKTTVKLLGQNVECLKSGDDYMINSYKKKSDLNSLNPSNLTVENVNARRNGSCNTTYEDPYRDDKDNSSSSCSSPNHAEAELEDDSANMVLRISEDENISSASSPVPSSSDVILLDKSDQVDGDSCKEKPVPDVNNMCTESFTKTSSFSKVGHIKKTVICGVRKQLSTDKCSDNSDDFDDLIGTMSPKEIELTKKNNNGVTISDLRKEVEDVLNTSYSNSDSSEVNEKSYQNSEVSAKSIKKSVKNASCNLASKDDKKSSDTNNKKVLVTSDTVTKVLGSSDQIIDSCEEDKRDEESSDTEEASGSTVDSGISKVSTSTSSDGDDEECPMETDSEKDFGFSSNEMIVLSEEGDVLSRNCENTPKLNANQSSEISEPEKLMETDVLDISDNQGNGEITTSETEESDDLIKVYTIKYDAEHDPGDGIVHKIVKGTAEERELKAKGLLTEQPDKNDSKDNGDKKNNFTIVCITKAGEAKDADKAEGLKLHFSLKRPREKNDEQVDSKKMKVLETRVENELEIPKNEPPPEKVEPVPKQKKVKVSDSEHSAKRLIDKELKNEVAKTLKKEFSTLKSGLKKASGSKLSFLKELMIRRGLEKVSKKGLEEFALQKICEAINHTCQLAEFAEEIKVKDIALETLRTKFGSLHKQFADLDIVQSRIASEMRKAKDPREVVPVKITRSVGLQVSLQPLKAKPTLPVPVPPTPEPVPVSPVVAPVKKKTQRTSAAANRAAMLPPPPPALTPAPTHISRPQVPTGKGIKTILPKVSNNTEARDGSGSLLGNILQKSATLNSSPAASSPRKSTGNTVKVIDLTDEDDSNRASTSNGPSTSGNIRVVASHQLTNTTQDTIQPIVATNMSRVAYLVQTPGQQGQQVLLATTSAPTKPGQARPTLMFNPVVPQGTPKLNLVRAAGHVSNAVAVIPSSLSTPGVCKYVTTYTPGPLTRSPTQTTRAIAPAPRHPAPLPGPPPVQPSQPTWKLMPPKPSLKITLAGDGIVLSWRILNKDMALYEEIASYQLYAYQETSAAPTTEMWRKVGDVKALALPMACTLTQFTDGNKYHFAVRGVDVKSRVGPFSTPEQITLPAQQ